MSNIVTIKKIDPNNFLLQDYTSEDEILIPNFNKELNFNPNEDYLEYFIYDLNNTLLFFNIDGYNNYKLSDNQLIIDPEKDIKLNEFNIGSFYTLYNFLKHKLYSSPTQTFYIEEISSDRTEIRLNTTKINNKDVVESVSILQKEIEDSKGNYKDFYLNFGNNNLIIATNILLDNDNIKDPSVLIKLYEPLPNNFSIKNECWVVEKISESNAYYININEIFDSTSDNINLRGPNFNLNIQDQINNTSDYLSYNTLISTNNSQGSGSLKNQIDSILEEKGIEINIDHTDYENFIFFSSALTRLENFYYKLSLIEEFTYSSSLSSGTSTNYYVSSSNLIYQNKINEIISNFDNYEYFLYYDSGSKAWPKSNSTPPFVNYLTTSTSGSNFLVTQSISASSFDNGNVNALINAIPDYLREDSNNDNYILFVEMIGQHFDNIWIYLKDIPNKFDADNRINYGISKDLITQTLKEFGVKIYQNNFSTNNLYSALLGITPSGSLFNLPFTTGSLPTPTEYEYINNYITSSYSTSSLPSVEDINVGIYKRIYHNLPYLLKKKGTTTGLKTLITLYGVPDTILDINEFGNQSTIDPNKYDYWYNKFNYSFDTPSNSNVTIPWIPLSSSLLYPKAVEFRFKTPGLPTSSIPYSQSLVNFSNNEFNLILEYTGSGNSSGSYSGSIIDLNYQYATLKFYHSSSNSSCSVYLPFYDGDWWSVLINANSGSSNTTYTLYTKNKIYNGDDGYSIGFQASSSFSSSKHWNQGGTGSLYLGSSGSSIINSKTYTKFSGSFQEFRYYNTILSESKFNDYVMNPYSILGNMTSGSQSSFNILSFRASLGSDLYTTRSSSIHPSITGSLPVTQSFSTGNSLFTFTGSYTFQPNKEIIFENSFPTGIKNKVSKRIRNKNLIIPYSSSDNNVPNSNVLSPFLSIQQSIPVSSSYTKNINYIEVGFSPQNEINKDIIEQLGYFNIGEYIGDPRQISQSLNYYPELNKLRDGYFLKYIKNYNIWDYIRIIKYFDNSLFKMIKDWIPARTNASTGIIIKQHLLERNKYPLPQTSISTSFAIVGHSSSSIFNIPYGDKNIILTGSTNQTPGLLYDQKIYTSSLSDPLRLETITSSQAGLFPNLNDQTSSLDFIVNVTQSWIGINQTPSGALSFTQNTQEEFYNGELSGSTITTTTQSLNITGSFDPLYDSMLNNVSESNSQSLFMDVDYRTSQIQPVNFNAIINKTARGANVQNSNYTLLRNILPRYSGSKVHSIDYNIYTPSSSFNISASKFGYTGSWGGDKSFGKNSVIDVYKSFGLYFNGGTGLSPELPRKTSFAVLFMFDGEGNIYDPSLSGSYYDNFLFNFGKDNKVNVTLKDLSFVLPTTVAAVVGEKNIHHPQSGIVSPLTTQTSSLFISSSMTFDNGIISTQINFPFFTTGSNSKSVLTASSTLSNNILIPNITSSIELHYQTTTAGNRIGFSTYPDVLIPAGFNQYDIIRFNSGFVDYSQDYLIMSSSVSASLVVIFLNKEITGSTTSPTVNLNTFTSLRYLPSPNNIMLDIDKPALAVTGKGFILPQYPSPTFSKNLPNIIKDLTEKNQI